MENATDIIIRPKGSRERKERKCHLIFEIYLTPDTIIQSLTPAVCLEYEPKSNNKQQTMTEEFDQNSLLHISPVVIAVIGKYFTFLKARYSSSPSNVSMDCQTTIVKLQP